MNARPDPRPMRLDAEAVRMIVLSPADGSQDLYVSLMLGIPQRRVGIMRSRLLAAFAARRNKRTDGTKETKR